MNLKIEVRSWNNYFPPPPHTHTSGLGLLDLPCTKEQLLMDENLFSGTTKYQIYQKHLIASENKPVWITSNCMVSMATHQAL